ncbi:MAG: DUF99 family protein [Candidatus Marsarchaeota archaeon]|jgi:endonuclease V-like protein UPF0215 family|nr:DUF99 family protein [Candidatus Marsarchaeota archaeon]
MKEGVRILSISCAPLEGKKTMLLGIVSRDGIIEGAISTKVTVDGIDSTNKIIKFVKKSKFKDQIKIIAVNGIGIAGLNIINVYALEDALNVKVLSITRNKPRPSKLIKALIAFSRAEKVDVKERIKIVKKISKINIIKLDRFYAQTYFEKKEAEKFYKEAFNMLRIAHIMLTAIAKGESKGRL